MTVGFDLRYQKKEVSWLAVPSGKKTWRPRLSWRQICGIIGHETIIAIDETGSISKLTAFGGDLGSITLNLRR